MIIILAILIFCFHCEIAKWLTIFPNEDIGNYFQKDENALHCFYCYPSCDDTSYDVSSWNTYMTPGEFNTNLL